MENWESQAPRCHGWMATIHLILTRPDELWAISSHRHRVCAKSHQLLISRFYEWRTKRRFGAKIYSRQRTLLTFLPFEESVFVGIWRIISLSPAELAHLKELISPARHQTGRNWEAKFHFLALCWSSLAGKTSPLPHNSRSEQIKGQLQREDIKRHTAHGEQQ